MTKALVGISVTVAAVVIIAGAILLNAPDRAGDDSSADASQNSAHSEPNGESNEVTIKNFNFVQSKIRIKKGTAVTWTNQDSARHDIMPDSPSENFKASQLLAKGESYSFTFNTAGTYSYYCSPHPYMKASVEVVE